jgi:hypothetical protein
VGDVSGSGANLLLSAMFSETVNSLFNLIQFFILMCCTNSQMANYRYSTKEENNNNNKNSK